MRRSRILRTIVLLFALVISAAMVLAAIVPDWIERLTAVDPDGGSGALESVIPLVVAGVLVLALTVLLRRRIAWTWSRIAMLATNRRGSTPRGRAS